MPHKWWVSSGRYCSPPHPWLIMEEFVFSSPPKISLFRSNSPSFQITPSLLRVIVCVCVCVCTLPVINECVFPLHMCSHSSVPCVGMCVCVITRGSYWISSQCRGRLRNRHVPRQTRTDTQCTCHYTVTQDGCLCRQATHAPVYVEQGRAQSCKHTLSVYRLPTCASSLRAPTGLTLTDGSRRQAHMPTYYTEKLCCALDTSSSWEFSEMWRIEAVCF